MKGIFIDFYVMAYRLARKTDPDQRYGQAAEYANNMCTLWISFLIYFVVKDTAQLLGFPLTQLLVRVRLILDIVMIALFFLCGIVISAVIRRIPEMQALEDIQSRYHRLSVGRKISVLVFVIGTIVLSILL